MIKWIVRIIGSVSILLLAALIALGVYKLDWDHAYAPITPEQAADAKAYLDANLTPLPRGIERGSFTRGDGASLETMTLAHDAPKGTIVIVPGYTAPLELYAGTMSAFHEAGYGIAALSTRGQGRSTRATANPEKGYVEDYQILADDLDAYIETLDGPIYVFGNSMGGHIALLMAGENAPDVKAYSLLVPMAEILTGEFPYWIAEAMTGFYSVVGFGANYGVGRGDWTKPKDYAEPTSCAANPAKAHLRDALVALDPPLRVEGVTNKWVWETIRSTAAVASPEHLSKVSAPVLTITAGDDRVVSTPAAEKNCEGLPNCTLRRFEEARHCIMNETDEVRQAVWAETIAFFDQAGAD